MLHGERLPLAPAEHDAVEDLIGRHKRLRRTRETYKARRAFQAEHQLEDEDMRDLGRAHRRKLGERLEKVAHDGIHLSLTRRDPDETGPLLAHITGRDVDELYEISEDGLVVEITPPSGGAA